MFILLICNSLTSKFIVEINDNAIAVIYVDLISCLLKVECYFLIAYFSAHCISDHRISMPNPNPNPNLNHNPNPDKSPDHDFSPFGQRCGGQKFSGQKRGSPYFFNFF